MIESPTCLIHWQHEGLSFIFTLNIVFLRAQRQETNVPSEEQNPPTKPTKPQRVDPTPLSTPADSLYLDADHLSGVKRMDLPVGGTSWQCR